MWQALKLARLSLGKHEAKTFPKINQHGTRTEVQDTCCECWSLPGTQVQERERERAREREREREEEQLRTSPLSLVFLVQTAASRTQI